MQETDWQEAAIRLSEKFPRAFPRKISEKLTEDADAAIAVACSGGADSLCALLLTWAKFPEARERLVALHFDHAVRKESAADAEFVRGVCAALGVGFVCERLDSSERHSESEGALRAARLDFFERAMRERGAKILVQGHQRGDVAETMLMRLTRGAGTGGLCAPRPVSPQADGRVFVRPLLDFPKEKIVAALRECGIPWREDSTNAGTDYFRNRIRNQVLPELRAAAPFENFARSRRLLEEDADALDFLAERLMGEAASCRFREDAGTPDGKISSENHDAEYDFPKTQNPRKSGGTPLLPCPEERLMGEAASCRFREDAGSPNEFFQREERRGNATGRSGILAASDVRAGTPDGKISSENHDAEYDFPKTQNLRESGGTPLLPRPPERLMGEAASCRFREDAGTPGVFFQREERRGNAAGRSGILAASDVRAGTPDEKISSENLPAKNVFPQNQSPRESGGTPLLPCPPERLMGEAASCRFREDAGTPDRKISSENPDAECARRENPTPRESGGTPLLPSREYSFAKAKSFFGGDAGTPPLPNAIARRILHKIFAAEKIPLHAKLADALVDAVRAETPLNAETAGTRISLNAAGTLAFSEKKEAAAAVSPDGNTEISGVWTRESVEITPELFAQIRAGEFSPDETVFLAGTPEIFVRAWRPGERYRPLGAPGEKTLGDAFTDRKIPEARRKTLPVFADAAGAAWVPGLPPAERFRIRAAGGKALRLTYGAETLPLL